MADPTGSPPLQDDAGPGGGGPRDEAARERRRYRELLDFVPDACLTTDARGVVREANRAAAELLAAEEAALVGTRLADCVAETYRPAFAALLRRIPRRGPIDEVHVHLKPRGAVVTVPVVLGVAVGAGGEYRWLLRDETERMRSRMQAGWLREARTARQAMETAYAQLEAILGYLPVGAVISEAPSGRILTYNQAAEELFAYPLPLPESVEEYSQDFEGYHADGRRYGPDEWPMARALRTGQPVPGEDIEFVLPGGERRIFHVSAAPIRGADGAVVAGVATLADVTEPRRRAGIDQLLATVSDLLASSMDYSETVQQVAELCVRSLAEYCIVHVGERGEVRALGMAHRDAGRQESLRGLLRRLPLDPGGDHPVIRAVRTGEPQVLPEITETLLRELVETPEQLGIMRDLRLTSALIVPLRARGHTLGAMSLARTAGAPPYTADDLAVVEDLARRAALAVDNARLYREAQRAAGARQEVLGVVSHDLRNALNAALASTELLLDPEYGSGIGAARRQVETIRRALEHMHRLVQDLLEVEQIERGQLGLHLDRLPVLGVLEAVQELFGPLAAAASVRLETAARGHPGPMLADAARIVQALSNLVGNALKFTPAGGVVSVTAAREGEAVRFSVADTGPGIPQGDLTRVFDRFWKGQPGAPSGSGLGLAIARGIVEAHGGRIWAESEPGRGSTFHLTIPGAPAD